MLPMMRISPVMTEPTECQLIINFAEISKAVSASQLVSAQRLNPRPPLTRSEFAKIMDNTAPGNAQTAARNEYIPLVLKQGEQILYMVFHNCHHHPDSKTVKKHPASQTCNLKAGCLAGFTFSQNHFSSSSISAHAGHTRKKAKSYDLTTAAMTRQDTLLIS